MQWQDITIPIRPGMPVWPGDPEVTLKPDSRVANGESCNTSVLRCPTHTGTHCDAPWHFMEEGKKLQEVDTDLFFGEALVIEVPEAPLISAADLGEGPLPPRVLLKSRNADRVMGETFWEDFAALEVSAAERLVAEGVRLVGIDYLSIAPFGNSRPVHEILLGNEVFIIEGLRLQDIAPGPCEFTVLPLPLQDADGAPCRAFIGR